MRVYLLSILFPVIAVAQSAAIAPGARVRTVTPAVFTARFDAVFDSASADSIWVRHAYGYDMGTVFRASHLTLRRSQVASMHALVSRKRTRGALYGFLAGAAVGGVLFVTGAATDQSEDGMGLYAAMMGTLVAVPMATIIGALIGVEEWQQVIPLRSP